MAFFDRFFGKKETVKPIENQEEIEKQAKLEAEEKEAERLAKLKEEQEEAERLAKLKEEQEEAERLAKLKEEQEEAERLAKLKEEQEEAERLAKLKEEQEEADKLAEGEKPQKKGLFSKLFSGLTKTRDNLLHSVDEVLKGFKKIDEALYEELEEALIIADFGVETTLKIMEDLRALVKQRKIVEPALLKNTLAEIITSILTSQKVEPILQEGVPNIILVIGVNGAGKTTTIGKLSNQLKEEGHSVILAAADTFRAAAIEQLQIWADRAKVDLIKHEEGSDPAAVVYDGIKAAKARKADVLICDTAGRLQNKTNLMKELEKISRIIEREYPEAHKEVLIVLDATTGQNAISQVKLFKEAAQVNGIVLTKLDGTAKGGAIVGICQSMNVPVKYIGVGEKIEDLQVFDPENFAKALFAE